MNKVQSSSTHPYHICDDDATNTCSIITTHHVIHKLYTQHAGHVHFIPQCVCYEFLYKQIVLFVLQFVVK